MPTPMGNFEAVAHAFDPTIAPEDFFRSDTFAAFPASVREDILDFLVASTGICTAEEIEQLLAHCQRQMAQQVQAHY